MAENTIPADQNFAAVELSTLQEERVNNSIAKLKGNSAAVWSSIQSDNFEDKLKVASAVQDATPLRDDLGKTIELEHIVVQAVEIKDTDDKGNEIVNEQTGEVKTLTAARIILVGKDGKSYASISTGIFKAVENLVGVLGQPHTWPAPVKVKAVEQGPAMRRYLTLKFA